MMVIPHVLTPQTEDLTIVKMLRKSKGSTFGSNLPDWWAPVTPDDPAISKESDPIRFGSDPPNQVPPIG